MGGPLKSERSKCADCENLGGECPENCIVKMLYDANDERLARIYRIECRETGRRFRARYEHKRCQELKHPIEHDYQLAGERIGIGYKAVLYRIHDGIKRAWSKPTPELERLFSASICKKPVKPRYFLRTIKEILGKERSSQDGTD